MTADQLLQLLAASPLPDDQKAFWKAKIPTMTEAEMTNLSYILTATSTERLDQLDAWVDKREEQIAKELTEIGTTGVRQVYAVAEEADKQQTNADGFLAQSLNQI